VVGARRTNGRRSKNHKSIDALQSRISCMGPNSINAARFQPSEGGGGTSGAWGGLGGAKTVALGWEGGEIRKGLAGGSLRIQAR